VNDIASEKFTEIRGITYKEITYEDGNTILKTFDDECKMWITLRFAQGDDSQVVQNIIDTAVRVL
jgi:hypothetical protein